MSVSRSAHELSVHARAIIVIVLALPALGAGPVRAQAVAAVESRVMLDASQQALAGRMQAFQERTEAWIFARLRKLDGDLVPEERVFDYDNATHTVRVTRGEVVEKAGWYVNVTKKAIPPFVPEPLFSRYLEVNVHPATPHVGMLHATVYFTYLANGKSVMAGYMDYVPAVWYAADNARLSRAVEAVYEQRGVDIGRFRRQLCESAFGAKNHRDRLRAACVGTSLYDPPFMEITEQNFDLVTTAFEAFVATYFDILEDRSRQPFTPADLDARDAMRKRWLEDQLFADTMSMKVVPYEVWSFANQAPAVRF
jgi:coproporphyrinogen III oxidase